MWRGATETWLFQGKIIKMPLKKCLPYPSTPERLRTQLPVGPSHTYIWPWQTTMRKENMQGCMRIVVGPFTIKRT